MAEGLGFSAFDGLGLGRDASVFGIPLRRPFPSELEFFRKNPKVSGMAAEDDAIILNPFSELSPKERGAVQMNEAARIFMRRGDVARPNFSLTEQQVKAFSDYGDEDARRATIVGRIISGDPSALDVTDEQRRYAAHVLEVMVKAAMAGRR